ncbi:MAG: YgiQ family radical SAM protein [Thermodesulfobacteriota bacterium]
MFLPVTRAELRKAPPDIILVTGDAYVDAPHIGVAVIGRVLEDAGFTVGVIAQPDVSSADADIKRLGAPRLFWGVTGGCVDSLVANRTALGKPRRTDDMTPGGKNDRRPDRAAIVYANLIRRAFGKTAPIVLGGIEASLRRVSHYDYWSDTIRRPLILDAKADVLVYGMAEETVVLLARAYARGEDVRGIPGIAVMEKQARPDYLSAPSHEDCVKDPSAFSALFPLVMENSEQPGAAGICQPCGDRVLVVNPPAAPLSPAELDRVHELCYMRDAHPYYKSKGEVRAVSTIANSLASHRGCFGGCSFCAIAAHQGRRVVSRSVASLLSEARALAKLPGFSGVISDVGGPTANMYGMSCPVWEKSGPCRDRLCLFPEPCRNLRFAHREQIALLKSLAGVEGMKRVFVGSGVRHDLVTADRAYGGRYLAELCAGFISGQMKIAPEHIEDAVLRLMKKPGRAALDAFLELFSRARERAGKKVFLTYYFMAAHPGCTLSHMRKLSEYAENTLRITPEQVQVFTPTPMTLATLLYATGRDPATGEKVIVERGIKGKAAQKSALAPAGPLPQIPRRRRAVPK